MTAEEAISEVKYVVFRNTDNFEMRISKECYKTIIKALEKQIPKKPNIYGDGYDNDGNLIYDTYDCPSCHTSYEMEYEKYDCCPSCGQVLDWNNNE